MSSQTDPVTRPVTPASDPASRSDSAATRKVDFIGAPTLAILAGCVLSALGYGRENAFLTWQLPLALLGLALAYVGFQWVRARR